MATKLKTLVKSKLTQTVVQIILTILVLVVNLSLMFLGHYENSYYSGSIYGTDDFRYEFTRRVHNVVEKELVLRSPEHIEAMTQDDKTQDYNALIARWYQIQSNLSDAPSFKYYIHNDETGEVYSNFSKLKDIDSLDQYPFHLTIESNKIQAIEIDKGKIIYLETYPQSRLLNQAVDMGNWEGTFVLQPPIKDGDLFGLLDQKYRAISPFFENQSQVYAGMVFMVLIGIFLFVYLISAVIIEKNTDRGLVDLIPNDLKVFLILISFPIMINGIIDEFSFEPFIMSIKQGDQWLEIAIIAIVFLWVFLGLRFTLSLIKALAEGEFFKNTIVYMVFKKIKDIVLRFLRGISSSKTFRRRVMLYTSLYAIVNFSFGVLLRNMGLTGLFMCFLFNVLCLYLVFKNLQSIQMIMRYVSEGHMDEPLALTDMSPLFYDFASHLDGLNQKLQLAIKEAIKGERLKTELITNVSHDLKTPLTAIVNYVTLLNQKSFEDEEANQYVVIINEKVNVLKKLVDDVLEVSKVSSGNVDIHLEKLDINQLIQQVLGELEKELSDQGLQVISTDLNSPLYVKADSLKLWRVVQNLVANISKYALPNSRVFILASTSDDKVAVTFKNISKEMLMTGNNELMERFVRGDVSRSQEGFGLGLAIAGDLMKLQNGTLEIIMDGDLFKVVLTLNVCEKQENDL